ncbi:unnamed protein product [Polarella glacialis]|uniref:Thioredoxin domain-containing protein n=1 Tax=Polarella glacialis TaxID=89957 RepID=A0A813DDL1_POLGL|nr:unnamed protein product [Polarella glacialis]
MFCPSNSRWALSCCCLVVAWAAEDAVAPLKALETLTAFEFEEKVLQVGNGSESQKVVPIVMFHQPWCEHCRNAIPELDQAAVSIAEGKYAMLPALKFYLFSCAEAGGKEICDLHCGTSFPSIMVFRDGRAIKYNRPRVANVFAWWIYRVTRPAVMELSEKTDWDGVQQRGLAFLLRVPAKHSKVETELILGNWQQLALDSLDKLDFFVAFEGKELADSIGGPVPSVHVGGPASYQLEPTAFEALEDEEVMKEWVQINQFEPVIALNPYNWGDVVSTELAAITLLHANDEEAAAALKVFQLKARELRTGRKYLFASLNVSDEESRMLISKKLPLFTPALLQGPQMFVFQEGSDGKLVYWEDPKFNRVLDLSILEVESLMASEEAKQDQSWECWAKHIRKASVRLGSHSPRSLAVAVAVPALVLYLMVKSSMALVGALFPAALQDASSKKSK